MKSLFTLLVVSTLFAPIKQETNKLHFSKKNIRYVWSIHFIKDAKMISYSISENVNEYDFTLNFVPDKILIKFKNGCICSKITYEKNYKTIQRISIDLIEYPNKISLNYNFSTNLYATHPDGNPDANMIVATGEFREISPNCDCK